MTHPIPPGTRDILPEEMGELRAVETTLHELFAARGYGEVSTPTIEFHDVLARGDARMMASAYRFFDPEGDQLALRSDMTVPIARLVADRFADAEPPFRLQYIGSAYRAVRPERGQMREFRQAGVELIGKEAPGGTAELVELLVAALDAVGLSRAVVGLGDADLFRQLLDELQVAGPAAERILDRLAAHDLVAIEAEAGELAGIGEAERALIVELSSLRGGADVLERARAIGGEAVERASGRLAGTYRELVERGVAGRVQLDLGLLRDLGYYTGAILEVYDPALGHIIGGGGRYDGLMGRFGRQLPAAGFALYVERVHIAQAEEERLAAERDERPGEGRA
jgi:ATP phosphoribosyltransferase regulatory subunit